jgi:hypothetical protein
LPGASPGDALRCCSVSVYSGLKVTCKGSAAQSLSPGIHDVANEHTVAGTKT